MADKTGISWTDATWNPVTGCSKVSPGCDHCYAETITQRWPERFPNGFDITLRPERMSQPVRWRRPRRIFVNSMSDLWHEKIPEPFLTQVWEVMLKANQHIYQILTKRPGIAREKIKRLGLPLPPHIWIGVSVEDQQRADHRIPILLDIPAEVRFLSCEPLLGLVDLTKIDYGKVLNAALRDYKEWREHTPFALQPHEVVPDKVAFLNPLNGTFFDGWDRGQGGSRIHWVIVGGESGVIRRPMDYEWARTIRDQCVNADVAFFYKQGNAMHSGQDTLLDGRKWEEYPAMPEPATQGALL